MSQKMRHTDSILMSSKVKAAAAAVEMNRASVVLSVEQEKS